MSKPKCPICGFPEEGVDDDGVDLCEDCGCCWACCCCHLEDGS